LNDEPEEPLAEFEAPDIATDFEDYYTREKEMKEILTRSRSFWKSFVDQIAAVYHPQLVPIKENGIIIGWVDSRTGMQPWFS
jgi:hypothetical protein